jgi:uncharacterized protein (DUF1684 family)
MEDRLDLLDWRRRVFGMYAEVRARRDPVAAWGRWRTLRDRLFARHPESPLSAAERSGFAGLRYFPYDPAWRVAAEVERADGSGIEIATSGEEPYRFLRVGQARFEAEGAAHALDLYWLDGYGGGLFLPFADATSGTETYGAGRYLLDTVKGADLGVEGGRLVLDFNFAYNPSCAYDPRWVCPLAPPGNRLGTRMRAGERTYAPEEPPDA